MTARAAISGLLLASYLQACTAYHRSDGAMAQIVAVPGSVSPLRVTTLGGERIEVWSPTVAKDTLYGANGAPGEATGRVALPLSAIKSTAVRRPDALLTAGAVVLAIGGAVALVAVIGALSEGVATEVYD